MSGPLVFQDTGLPDHDISQELGRTLKYLFTEIEYEYGNVSTKDLDPWYVYHFFVGGATWSRGEQPNCLI